MHRQAMAYERKLNYYTADLDTMLIYKPWDREHANRYLEGIKAGIVVPVLLLTLALERETAAAVPRWQRRLIARGPGRD